MKGRTSARRWETGGAEERRGARRARGGQDGGSRVLALTAASLAAAALLSGCGIRATSVPVDAGAAPSRVGCAPPTSTPPAAPGAETSQVRVFLVCGSRVAPVEREVAIPQGRSSARRIPVARALLEELIEPPRHPERATGFESAVPQDLRVDGGTEADPKEALRLSVPLDELPAFALAQIVCTFSDSAAADTDDAVVLGGPAETAEEAERARPLERFECGSALRTRPEAAETAGTRV